MPLINCKVEISLKWFENCILSNSGTAATFKITDAKLYVPIVTLKTEDNTKLSKLLSDGFKRSIYWNEYKEIPEKIYAANENIRILIDPSWQGINRLFVFAYLNDATSTANSYRNYFLPRIKIENYNIEIDGRYFYDQPINDSIKQNDVIIYYIYKKSKETILEFFKGTTKVL